MRRAILKKFILVLLAALFINEGYDIYHRDD